MGSPAARAQDPCAALLDVYDTALPQVYGYLLRRCGTREVAEDLTSETFLAAADSARRAAGDAGDDFAPSVDVAWLIGVARHKLADHWRARAREDRGLQAVSSLPAEQSEPDWDAQLDALHASEVLAGLTPSYRLALTLRYVDDLPVAEVAELIGRTLHATEALLVRARAAFRAAYTAGEEDEDA